MVGGAGCRTGEHRVSPLKAHQGSGPPPTSPLMGVGSASSLQGVSPFLPSVILISSLSVLWNRLWGVQFPLRKAESLPAPTQTQAVAKNRQDHVSSQWETWADGVSALSQSRGTAPSPLHPGAEPTLTESHLSLSVQSWPPLFCVADSAPLEGISCLPPLPRVGGKAWSWDYSAIQSLLYLPFCVRERCH